MHDRLQQMAAILAWWWRLVASNKALNLLHWAMCMVTYRYVAMAIKTATFVGIFVDCCLFACCPGSRWGNTEQVVAWCQRPVASGVALDMPHWAMPSVLLRRIHKAFETGHNGGAFVCHHQFVIDHNRSKITCNSQYKLKLRHSDIYYNIISLLLCFGCPSTTMDAVSATIVNGGQANIN